MNAFRPSTARIADGPLFATLTFLVSLAIAFAAGTAVAVAFVVVAALRGTHRGSDLAVAAQTQAASMATLLVTQAAILATALLACRLLGRAPRERLWLAPPALGPGRAVVLVAASIVPFVAGLFAAAFMPSLAGAAEGFVEMWSSASRFTSASWVILIGVIPGITEEFLFRGLILRGFLVRWRPWAAIVVSSVLFGIMHVDPAHAAFATVLGLWLGTVAWRTRSIVIPIITHATINGSWTFFQMVLHRRPDLEGAATIVAGVVVLLSVVAFVTSIVMLVRFGRAAPSAVPGLIPPPIVAPPAITASPAPRAGARRIAFGGIALTLAWLLVAATVPEPPPPVSAASAVAPTEVEMRSRLSSHVRIESGRPAALTLVRGAPIALVFPANRPGLEEALIELDLDGSTIWLRYDGAISGKKVGRGILEQLRSGDPSSLLVRITGGDLESGLSTVCELIDDQATFDSTWARCEAETGWAMRGK